MRSNRGHRKQSALPRARRPGRLGAGYEASRRCGNRRLPVEDVLDDAVGVHCDAFRVVAQFGQNVIGVKSENLIGSS